MKSTSKIIVFIFTFLALTTSAHAQSPRKQLNQLVQQFQKTPNDSALREKIIKLAASIKPAPAIPEEAREPFVMGAAVLKKASDPAGASKAANLFTQALNIAPWFADAYYNRAVAHEAAGQFEPAIDDLKLYLGFKLTDAERREAQDKIYTLKANAQLTAAKKTEDDKINALIPGTAYLISTDSSELTDKKTGLIWRRCVEGMVFSGGTCSGEALELSYEDVLQRAKSEASRSGKAWRVPEAHELVGLVDRSRSPMINPTAFPAQPCTTEQERGSYATCSFRSATRGAQYSHGVGHVTVTFRDGAGQLTGDTAFDKYTFFLRLVRDGQ